MDSAGVSTQLARLLDQVGRPSEDARRKELARREREESRKEELNHERKLAKARKGPTIPPLVWIGTNAEFASLVEQLYKAKMLKLTGASITDLKAVCEHFVNKDGEPLKPRSVHECFAHMKDEKGRDVEPLSIRRR